MLNPLCSRCLKEFAPYELVLGVCAWCWRKNDPELHEEICDQRDNQTGLFDEEEDKKEDNE